MEGAGVSPIHHVPTRISIRVEVQEAGGTASYEANATLDAGQRYKYSLEKGTWYEKVKGRKTLVGKPAVKEVVGPDGLKKNVICVVIRVEQLLR